MGDNLMLFIQGLFAGVFVVLVYKIFIKKKKE